MEVVWWGRITYPVASKVRKEEGEDTRLSQLPLRTYRNTLTSLPAPHATLHSFLLPCGVPQTAPHACDRGAWRRMLQFHRIAWSCCISKWPVISRDFHIPLIFRFTFNLRSLCVACCCFVVVSYYCPLLGIERRSSFIPNERSPFKHQPCSFGYPSSFTVNTIVIFSCTSLSRM